MAVLIFWKEGGLVQVVGVQGYNVDGDKEN